MGQAPWLIMNQKDIADGQQLQFDIRSDSSIFYADARDLRERLARGLTQVLTALAVYPRG